MQIRKWALLSAWVGAALVSGAASTAAGSDRKAIEVFIYHLARMSTPANETTTPALTKVSAVGATAEPAAIEFAEVDAPAVSEYHVCFTESNRRGERLGNLEGRQVKGWTIRLTQLENIEQLVPNCRMLLVTRREEGTIDAMMLAKDGVLTIGTTQRFARTGGTFFVDEVGSKISFEINLTAATAAGMRPNAKLLQLASEVYD